MKNFSRAWPAAVVLALGLALSGCAVDTSASADAPSKAQTRKQRQDRKAVKATKERQERKDVRSGGDAQGAPTAKKAPAPSKVTSSASAKTNQRSKSKSKSKPEPEPEPTLVWTCWWSPTTDQDWHNDVECGNGIAWERPRLREWDDHVQKREIMESAKRYARERNAG